MAVMEMLAVKMTGRRTQQDLLIQASNNSGFQFPFMTILIQCTSTRKGPAEHDT